MLQLKSRIKYKISFILFVTCSLMGFGLIQAKQDLPRIDIESVRKDVMLDSNIQLPHDFISSLEQWKFNVLYVGNICFVHIPYRDYDTDCFMKSSVVAVYRFESAKWIYKYGLPYYFKFSKMNDNDADLLFLSNNRFCEPNGRCNTYVEICEFKEDDLVPLASYRGFDKYNYYYYHFLVLEERKDIKKVIGDTIINDVKLSDFLFNRKEAKYTVERRIGILKDIYDDSLLVQDKVFKHELNIKGL